MTWYPPRQVGLSNHDRIEPSLRLETKHVDSEIAAIFVRNSVYGP